ncbi:MAG: HlyD family type I secretion periplasmic adaptor subunit [Pseudomonadota bacterium]
MSDRVGGSGTIRAGLAVIVLGVGGFGAWAATAPLDSAAVAHGEVKVENYRKTVQHREGGIVREILVRDGTRVTAGQPLVRLDDTPILARWRQLESRLWDALATRARLTAERDGSPEPDFSDLAGIDDGRAADVRRAQANLFHAARAARQGKQGVLEKRILLLEREADAMAAERRSKGLQLTLVHEEVATVRRLVRRGLAKKPRLLALQREAAKLEGERDDYGARIARIGQAIAATELEIANLATDHLNQVASGLREVEAEIRSLDEEMTAVRDALTRTVVRAPRGGVVVGLQVHTVGAVLQPGDRIMEIVPQNETLVVEARIRPEDIDRVHAGREARVRFRTFLRGLTPPAEGRVTQVSADLFRDEATGAGYYLARVRLDPASVERLPGELVPGMQTDVLITTGERTALEYLLAPLTRAMDMAMREK